MTMWKAFIKIILLMFVMCVDTHAQIRGARSDRKIVEIKKIVDLTRNQETAIRQAHDTYNRTVDSSLYNVDDPVLASEMKYRASKVFHESLMDVFTEKQRNRYIEVTSAPEVRMKADYKVGLLRESNKYSERELEAKRTAIYNYMMSEKIVYVRDKYNIKKQKDNIERLKTIQPRALKESNIREKQKAQGRIRPDGSIQWQIK